MMKFNTARHDLKSHFENVKQLVSQMLKLAEQGVLMLPELLEKDGTVRGSNGALHKERFTLPDQKAQSGAETRTIMVQSPGEGAYAFVIRTGRNLVATVFCNRLENNTYLCETRWNKRLSKFDITNAEYLGEKDFKLGIGN
jgi:hypothetical protein